MEELCSRRCATGCSRARLAQPGRAWLCAFSNNALRRVVELRAPEPLDALLQPCSPLEVPQGSSRGPAEPAQRAGCSSASGNTRREPGPAEAAEEWLASAGTTSVHLLLRGEGPDRVRIATLEILRAVQPCRDALAGGRGLAKCRGLPDPVLWLHGVAHHAQRELPVTLLVDLSAEAECCQCRCLVSGSFKSSKGRQLLGPRVDNEPKRGWTPLHTAAQCGDLATLKFLCTAGVDLDRPCHDGRTLLFVAASAGHVDTVRYLLGARADKDRVSRDHRSPLHIASSKGHGGVVELLCASGAEKDGHAGGTGMTPLVAAAFSGHGEVVACLRDAGADVNKATSVGVTPLGAAAASGWLQVLFDLSFATGIALDKKDGKGATPLEWAARGGHVEAAKLLCIVGASQERALERVVDLGHHRALQVLFAASVRVEGRPRFNSLRLLFRAAEKGHTEIVRRLLEIGGDKDGLAPDGRSLLHVAAARGHAGVIQLLCGSGAQVDARAQGDGATPLIAAVRGGHVEAVKRLCEAGADVNSTTQGGTSPLGAAASGGWTEVIRVLCDAGAAIDLPARDGSTPLHRAAYEGHLEAVELLCSYGAGMDVATHAGITALGAATMARRWQVMRFLCSQGAGKHAASWFSGQLLEKAGGQGQCRQAPINTNNRTGKGKPRKLGKRMGPTRGTPVPFLPAVGESIGAGQRWPPSQDFVMRTDSCGVAFAGPRSETRLADDGRKYTEQQFLEYYGVLDGKVRWRIARRRHPGVGSSAKLADQRIDGASFLSLP